MNIIYTQPIYCICINIGQIIYYASIYLFLTCPKPVLLFFLLPLTLFSSSFPLHLFSYTLSYFLTHPQGMRKSLLWERGLLDYRGPVFVLPPLVENDIRHNIQKHIIPQRSKAKRAIIKYCNQRLPFHSIETYNNGIITSHLLALCPFLYIVGLEVCLFMY